jgi:hypothetical protein
MSTRPVVFLSHSSNDKLTAQKLASDLRNLGLGVWIDSERIKYGQSIPKAIEDGLRLSVAVLVLVSEAFLRSRWCRAEYEPLLSTEIDSGRTLIIPVLLESCEMPLMLRSKRYCDLTVNSSDRNLSDLAAQIAAEHQQRGAALPLDQELSTGSPTDKLSSALELLDPDSLAGEALKNANTQAAIGLLEEVTRLIELFETQYDELATVLTEAAYESGIYGSAHRVPRSRLLQVNRKLVTVSNEMRSITRNIERRFFLTLRTKDIIDAITKTCLQIAVTEDFLVIEGVANSDGVHFDLHEQQEMLTHAVRHNIVEFGDWSHSEGGRGFVERYHDVLIKLNDYKIALKETVLDLERQSAGR